MRPSRVVLLLAISLCLSPVYSSDYGVTKDSLCIIPNYNGPLVKCATNVTEPETERYEADCTQEKCTCMYHVNTFTQNCTYNTTSHFTRRCKDFHRNCTFLADPKGGVATCNESYGECVITSDVLESRLAVGYPQYNPPICYPGLRAAKDGCNATLSRCRGRVAFKFASTTTKRLENCRNTCELEKTTCTNYTKSCNNATTSWKERYEAAEVDEACDVITNKCEEEREMKWQSVSGRDYRRSVHQKPKKNTVLITTQNCGVTSNLTGSVRFCTDSLNFRMKYKAECQLYGVILTKYLFENVYKANTSISNVTSFLTSEWGVIKQLCTLDCFRTITRELRFCINDLPIQNILPGITHPQLQYIMYRSADLLCASVAEKKVEESCVLYLDKDSDLSKEVIKNMSESCSTEKSQWKNGRTVTCSQRCKNYLLKSVIARDHKPGCCVADLMKFKKVTSPWVEMLSPDVYRSNMLVYLVEQCSLTEQLSSCTESDTMHPAVIFVLAVIGVFSVGLSAGVIVFIVIFYRQMDYEGYKKGFLHNIIT